MNVLILNDSSDPTRGGSYYFISTILQALAIAPAAHRFVTFSVDDAWKIDFNALLETSQIDFVWSMTPYHPIGNRPYATTVWDIAHRVTPAFPEVSVTGYTWLEREEKLAQCLPRSTYVISGNERGRQELIHAYRLFPENVRVIPFPVTRPIHSANARQADWLHPFPRKGYLFYPAQFWPHKNHILLVKAMCRLRDQGAPLHLVLSGSDKGNRSYIEGYCRENGLTDHVHFLGFVSDSVMEELYRNALALTYASFFGPTNLPPLEAMAFGCPVICSDVPGMREQLGEAALFFPPTDIDGLLRCVADIANPAIVERLDGMANALTARLSPMSYAAAIIRCLDEFAVIRECWGSSYQHS